jgi:2-polyprenyl-6-methoxyphenol hydroxylase-like FAD-dependent oxidoreductase
MRTAIVCGGGIAGLAAAIALARHGWSVDVYERGSAVREIGAGIFIKGNAQRVLRDFGVADQILRDCVVLREARTLAQDGTLLQRRLLRGGTIIWNAKREYVIRALYERAVALGARIHTDAAVESVDPGGSVRVRGQSLRADIVIAADGVHSLARQLLALERPVKTSQSGAIRLLVARTGRDADDFVREFWSGNLRVGLCPCSPSDLFGYFIAPLDDERGTRVPIDEEYWSARFPALADEGFFARARAADAVHHPYPLVRTRSWVKGAAVLLGDAAHALPPTLGQGAGLSLMNALLLADYISSKRELADALAAWQRDWRWVSDHTQLWSRRYDWITSEWPKAAYPLRNAVIWAIGKSSRFNNYMRIADRVDAPGHRLLPPAFIIAPLNEEASP